MSNPYPNSAEFSNCFDPNLNPHGIHYLTREQMAGTIADASLHAPWTVPLWRAAMAGQLNFAQPRRTQTLSKRALGHRLRPVVIILSDDDYVSTGPDRWLCAKRVMDWAQLVLVHGTGGKAEHYAWLAQAALSKRCTVLIETNSAHFQEWHKFALRWVRRRDCVRAIKAPAGVQHPAPIPRESMQ